MAIELNVGGAPLGLEQDFAAPATPWAYDFSVMSALYMWTAEGAPPISATPMRTLLGVGT